MPKPQRDHGTTWPLRHRATSWSFRWGAILGILVLLLALGVAWADAGPPSRLRVAVLDFDVLDLTDGDFDTAPLGRVMATELETKLVQTRRFAVITRLDLEKVLDELMLGATGVVNAEQARAFGEVAGVQLLITGSITVFGHGLIGISARLIDVSTGGLRDAETVRVSDAEGFTEAATLLADRAAALFPLKGTVVAIDGDEVIVDIGMLDGVGGTGDRGLVQRPRSFAGLTALQPIGTFVVLEAFADFSVIDVALDVDGAVAVGDVVSVVPAPTVSVAEATVSIEATPADAVIEVDGVPHSSSFRRAPGPVRVVVRAEGFVEEAFDLDLEAGAMVERVVTLVPRRATLVVVTVPEYAVLEVDGVESPERERELAPGAYRLVVRAEGYEPAEVEVDLRPGRQEVVHLALVPRRVAVVFETVPRGASIQIDGVERAASFKIAPGEYDVLVTAPGYADQGFRLRVRAGTAIHERIELSALPVPVAIDVVPAHAEVLVDGVAREGALLLPPGTYGVVVRADGYVEEQLELRVEPGEAVEVRVELRVEAGSVVVMPQAPGWSVRLTGASVDPHDVTEGVRTIWFDVAWDESWRGPSRPTWVQATDNWDAVWVFAKYRLANGPWHHVSLAARAPTLPAGAIVDVTRDGKGAFVYRDSPGYGTFDARRVGLLWDYRGDGVSEAADVELWLFAIEMVYVPRGGFLLGRAGSFNTRHRFQAGSTGDAFVVDAQSSISLGGGASQLNWRASSGSGTPEGSTHPSFPTGYDAFYIMKTELTQGQYVSFLNTLLQPQADRRKHDGSGDRYGVTGSAVGSYGTTLPYVAMNNLSWADGVAFSDWAALRPMTELEFEKAARGSGPALIDEFAWGDGHFAGVMALRDAGTSRETPTAFLAKPNANFRGRDGRELRSATGGPVRAGSFAAPGATRRGAGAGYFGVLDLSGNVHERVVTIGNSVGRAFTGAHGDGVLDEFGSADVAHWPSDDAVGAGIRGGSWMSSYADLRLTPRNHAASGNPDRRPTYGWRAVRTAP